MGCWDCVVRGAALRVDGFGAVPDAAPSDEAGAATARGEGAVVFRALGACGVFQQYHTNAKQTAAKRIASRLCSASMDRGLYSAGGGLSGLSRR